MVEEYSRYGNYTIETARRVLTAQGLPEVERVMNLAGWVWRAQDREWERENAQLYKEVA